MATGQVRVDPGNAGQASAWDGNEGDFWTENATQFDRSIAAYHEPFLEAAAIRATERVLDIGCGTGQTTRDAARIATEGEALGIDLSRRMIEYAVRAAADEGVANARFEVGDAQIHPFEAGAFDVAISRTGAMFFGDAVAGFSNIHRALCPGGRLVLLVWQSLERNEWLREIRTSLAAGRTMPAPPPDAPSPFSLSDPDRVRHVLGQAGFSDVTLSALTGPLYFGPDGEEAARFILGVAGWMLDGLDDEARASALAAFRRTIEAHTDSDGVRFGSATWLIEAHKAARRERNVWPAPG